MVDTIQIPRIDGRGSEGAPAWWAVRQHGQRSACVRCPNGHESYLNHIVAEDGTVSPSIVCPEKGCDWHVFGVLEGWSESS